MGGGGVPGWVPWVVEEGQRRWQAGCQAREGPALTSPATSTTDLLVIHTPNIYLTLSFLQTRPTSSSTCITCRVAQETSQYPTHKYINLCKNSPFIFLKVLPAVTTTI